MRDGLPQGWTTARLEDLFEILDSKRIPINEAERTRRLASSDARFPYYGATGQVGEIEDFIFEGEAVLLGEDGAPFLDSERSKAYLVQGKFRARCGLSNAFLRHQLNAVDYRPHVSGTTRLKLTQAAMADIRLAVAPTDEQTRIASRIDELFSRIEEGERALERVQKLVERYRQSVLKAAVTGDLTREWREQRKGQLESGEALLARILKARREAWEQAELDKMKAKGIRPASDQWKRKYQEPAAPDTTDLPNLPAGWLWASVEQLCFVDTGATPKRGTVKYYKNGTIDWITSSAVNERVIRSAAERITEAAIQETNTKVFPVGTLIVAMYGEGKTRGKVAELGIDAATNQACAALLCSHLGRDVRDYLRTFFEKNYLGLRAKAAGGVQPNLNLAILKATVLPLPPAVEMAPINDVVEGKLSQVAAFKTEFSTWERQQQALRQRILGHAFTGLLVDQDSADEPASALLARIAAERGQGGAPRRGRKASAAFRPT